MPLDITTTVTGLAIGGLTAPTYTLTADSAQNNSRQSIVTALGGTQTGVHTHSPSNPFSINVTKPQNAAAYPRLTSNGTKVGKTGRNRYTTLIRMGTVPIVGQPTEISDIRIEENIVSGAEVNDTANLAAMYSFAGAWFTREAANLLNRAKTGSQ